MFSMARGFSMSIIQFGLMELDSQERAKKSKEKIYDSVIWKFKN
jgi:hypothetical protein